MFLLIFLHHIPLTLICFNLTWRTPTVCWQHQSLSALSHRRKGWLRLLFAKRLNKANYLRKPSLNISVPRNAWWWYAVIKTFWIMLPICYHKEYIIIAYYYNTAEYVFCFDNSLIRTFLWSATQRCLSAFWWASSADIRFLFPWIVISQKGIFTMSLYGKHDVPLSADYKN